MAVRVGFVGTGGIAGAHISALKEIEDVELVAFMDADEERAAKAAANFPGAMAYSNLKEMLDGHELDTVYVCVPPNAHGKIETALCKRGIPFFVEKPVGIDRETPLRILEAVTAKGLLTSVGYMSRYRKTVERAKELLAQDAPVLARGGWIGSMPGVFWWRRKAMSGGQIMEQTTHTFDLARHLLGDVSMVFCVGRKGLITGVDNYDVEDASICTLVFESGLIGEIASSCAVGAGGGVTLEVFGRESWLKLGGWDLSLETIKGSETWRLASTDNVFAAEDRVWIEAVKTGDGSKIRSPYADAVKTQLVTCAATRSMASGRPETP
jgi:predicted dehydrogenase